MSDGTELPAALHRTSYRAPDGTLYWLWLAGDCWHWRWYRDGNNDLVAADGRGSVALSEAAEVWDAMRAMLRGTGQ